MRRSVTLFLFPTETVLVLCLHTSLIDQVPIIIQIANPRYTTPKNPQNTMADPQGEVTLEAARKQKIHNLKLKTACLENEEFIQELHVSDWSENQRQKLCGAHEKAHELLTSVEVGTKWNLTEAYDLAKLMRVCGLEMSQRELYKPEDKPQFMDVIGLRKQLAELKNNRNKTRIVSFTGVIDNAITKVEKVEEELRRSQLDATQLAQVPATTLKQMEDIMNVTQIQAALTSTNEQVCCLGY